MWGRRKTTEQSPLPPKKELGEFREEKPEKVESKMEAVLERRHHVAAEAAHLEKFIFEFAEQEADKLMPPSETMNKIKLELDRRFPKLDEKIKSRYYWIAEKYIQIVEQARDQEKRLREEFNLNQYDSPEPFKNLGELIFCYRTGKRPVGKINFERQGGYLIIACEDSDDYEKARSIIEKPKPSGGTFHETFVLPGPATIRRSLPRPLAIFFTQFFSLIKKDFLGVGLDNVLLVNGTAETGGGTYEATVAHERQHFLNNSLFNQFEFLESDADTQNLRGVKDEILARIRDGSRDPSYCTDFLENQLYSFLTKRFANKEGINKLMEQIREQLVEILPMFGSEHQWAILTNLLVDIPLTRWPKWLTEMKHFYKARGYNNIHELARMAEEPREEEYHPSYFPYRDNLVEFGAEPYRSYAAEAVKTEQELFNLRAQIRSFSTEQAEDLTIPVPKETTDAFNKLKEMRRHYQELLDKLKLPDTDVLPHVESFGVVSSTVVLPEAEREQIQPIGRAISEVLSACNSEEMAYVYAEFIRHGAPGENVKVLEKHIKRFAESKGAENCEIKIERPHRYEGGLTCEIIFNLSGKNATKAKYYLNFYIGVPKIIQAAEVGSGM